MRFFLRIIYSSIILLVLLSITSHSIENTQDSLGVLHSYVDSLPLLKDDVEPTLPITHLILHNKKEAQDSVNDIELLPFQKNEGKTTTSGSDEVEMAKSVTQDSLDNESWNDYYKNNFTPFKQKSWHTNLIFNFSKKDQTNLETILVDIVERGRYDIGVGLSAGYFFKNYMSTGLNVVYNRSYSDLFYLNEGDTVNTKNVSQEFLITPFLRNYIPLGHTDRFSIFNETRLSFGYGESVSRTIYTIDSQDKTYGESYMARIGIKPGVNAFIVDNFSFEVAIDLIGFSMEYMSTEKNEELPGEVTNFDFDFKVDLLSTSFGVAYYF